MNAAEFLDWQRYSGTGLGTASAGERFKQLRQELSQAGANVVLVGVFLDQNHDVIDVALWRRTQVFGLEGTQVQLTAEALAAIGALGTAAAVREANGSRLGLTIPPVAGESAASRQEAIRQAMTGLQERILAKLPEMAKDLPAEALARLPRPRQTEGAETRTELRRLLEAYVVVHQEDLAGDVAKHGDPRQAPGFDPLRFLDEQAQEGRRLSLFREQRARLSLLREKLEQLTRRMETDPPDAASTQEERQKVLEEYRRYNKYAPEDRIPEVEAWLQNVRRLRDERPDVFRPRATRDDRVNAELTAIGAYNAEIRGDGRTVTWRQPPGLECGWTRFALVFHVFLRDKERDPARLATAFDKLTAEWRQFQPRFPELEPQLKQYVLEFFRNYRQSDLSGDERADYEDEDGRITDDKVLANVTGASVDLVVNPSGGTELSIHFGARWDEEHGVEVQFDEHGEIRRWF